MTTTIEQLPALKKRRNGLALQGAQYGISADPRITIELQDLETIISQMDLIDIHRGNLNQLLRQREHFGAHVPPHIVNQITHEREEIQRLRLICAKYRQPVEAHPVDADDVGIEAAPVVPAAFPPDPITRVREALRDIEALLRHGETAAALRAIQALRRDIS